MGFKEASWAHLSSRKDEEKLQEEDCLLYIFCLIALFFASLRYSLANFVYYFVLHLVFIQSSSNLYL